MSKSILYEFMMNLDISHFTYFYNFEPKWNIVYFVPKWDWPIILNYNAINNNSSLLSIYYVSSTIQSTVSGLNC